MGRVTLQIVEYLRPIDRLVSSTAVAASPLPSLDRPAVGRPRCRLRRLVVAAPRRVLRAVTRQRSRMGRGVLCAGAPRQLPALHGHGVSRLRGRRSHHASSLHRSRHAGTGHSRRARPPRAAPAAGALHRLRDVEPVALHRAELRPADDVRAAGRTRGVAGAGAAVEARVRGIVRHAARRLQRGAVVGSDGAVVGAAAGRDPDRGLDGGGNLRGPRHRHAVVHRAASRRQGGGAGAALPDPGLVVRRADRAVVGDQRAHAADPLQLRHPGGDALGAELCGSPSTSPAASRGRRGGRRPTGRR